MNVKEAAHTLELAERITQACRVIGGYDPEADPDAWVDFAVELIGEMRDTGVVVALATPGPPFFRYETGAGIEFYDADEVDEWWSGHVSQPTPTEGGPQ